MNLKKILHFALDNYFISIFIAVIIFVGFVSVFKMFFTKPVYVYTKVKVGQGLWWASTQKPSIWFVSAIKKEEEEKNLVGQPIAKILNVRYYPWWGTNQYDIYVTLKLRVTGNKKTGNYSFNRSNIGIGSAIDLEFPSTQFSGTITELSDKPIVDKYIEKTIYLTKKAAYPWEYDAIKIGDKYFDGEDTVFEILDKKATDVAVMSPDTYGNLTPSTSDIGKYITVKAKIKGRIFDNQLFFGEDQLVSYGNTFNIATSNFTFTNFVVAGIE